MQLRHLLKALSSSAMFSDAGYAAGNRLLHTWLQFWAVDEAPPVSDHAAIEQTDEDRQGILALLTAHKRRLRSLEAQRALRGPGAPPEIGLEIDDINARSPS